MASGVRIEVRLTPKAARNMILGVRAAADGRGQLCVKVTAAPERGKANRALLRLLAESWQMPVSRFQLLAGETDRNKIVLLEGSAAKLLPRLQAWAAEAVP